MKTKYISLKDQQYRQQLERENRAAQERSDAIVSKALSMYFGEEKGLFSIYPAIHPLSVRINALQKYLDGLIDARDEMLVQYAGIDDRAITWTFQVEIANALRELAKLRCEQVLPVLSDRLPKGR